MFTGIIRHVGTIRSSSPSSAGRTLTIDTGPLAQTLGVGDSLAVDGVCLTLSSPGRNRLGTFDVVGETLDRTTLGKLTVGSKVNLEPALRSGQGFDGHIVQGHIDGLARIDRIDRSDGRWEVHFAAQPQLLGQMVPKGSVAVAGASLTLATVSADRFSVALIPTTLAGTTLATMQPGMEVNIETDVVGKYVKQYLKQMIAGSDEAGSPAAGISLETLRRAGFA